MSAAPGHPPVRTLGGTGRLTGLPRDHHFAKIVELIQFALPFFAASVRTMEIINEKGLNQELALFITNTGRNKGLPYFAISENMEDEMRGNSPAADIGIYLHLDDNAIAPPLITVFEGKRLTTTLGAPRRREYVIGHKQKGKHLHCGGIERFKLAIHGSKLVKAGMIGYLQDGIPEQWREKINVWIAELGREQNDPAWCEQEQLSPPVTAGQVSTCSSVVVRKNDELLLTHLWINLNSRN